MITATAYQNQNVAVFGLGKAGEAAVKSLLAGGAKVFAWDDSFKPSPPEGEGRVGGDTSSDRARITPHPNLPPQGGRGLWRLPISDWPWDTLKALVLSPGVPLSHPVAALAKKNNCPVIGDIELLYQACPDARYVAITGTNGKSTTTTLIGHILKHAGIQTEIGGNLGTPALELKPLGADGTYVLELSSYQLDLLHSTRFNVAVFLNITPDHLDRHGSMEEYVAAKKHIFDRQQADDVAVIAVDDDYTRGIWKLESGIKDRKAIKVSAHEVLDQGVYVKNAFLHDPSIPDSRFPIPEPPLTGKHNWQNAAAAYAAARACGVPAEKIYEAMKTFAGLRHRLQLVATINGVRFINDSKATNADATSHALAPYDTIYWIAGGKPKEGGIETLAPYFPKIAHAFLIGQAEAEFARTLDGKVPYTKCATLKNAVEKAAAMAFAEKKKDAVVLLSPACASFDQWKNFEQRGDAFCEMVLQLNKGARHAS